MANLFYRNRRLTVLILGLLAVAGAASLQTLARQEDPTLSRRFGRVTTFYPGASALRVESLVTEKIETRLQELHEIKEISSQSRTGVSVVRIELEDEYDESTVDEVWSKVRDKLADSEADLPAGAAAPDFEDQTSTALTLVVGFTWNGEGPIQLGLLTRLAEELENRLRNVPRTKETDLFGEAEEEVRVTVDPLALASLDLTVAEVSAAIARADAKMPAGQLRGARNDLLLEVRGELLSLERIRRIPVRQDAEGDSLLVGDVAVVEKAWREPPPAIALVGGETGVMVSATMESGHRVDRWAEQAREVVEAFRREIPDGVGYRVLFDQSVYTEERLGTLVGNLVLGAAIVVAVLFFMMGARSALVVASALPITFAAVLAELNLLGVPLHQTSITGLILALGLLIDNAIVVVDEYNLRARSGEAPGAAVAATVRHLFVPLAASTLTTVLAFLPIVLMPGGAGEFVGPISIGVGLSVVTSFLVTMTLIVALAAFSDRRRPAAAETSRWWRDGFSHEGLAGIYRRGLRLVLERPAIGVAFSLLLPLVGFGLAGTLSQQFFPANDRNQFQVQLVLPSQSSIEETRSAALEARALIHGHPEVQESHWMVGESPPRVFYNMFGNEDGVASFAGGFVTTLSPEATERLLPALQRELIEAFPGARVVALPFEQGPPFDAPIEVRIVGPDLEELRRLGDAMRAVLARTENVTFTAAKLAGGEPKLRVEADEDAARLTGLRLADIADQLNARLEGALGGSVLEANEEIPVRVRVAQADRESLAGIESGRLLAPVREGAADRSTLPGVPLSALAETRLVPELATVNRRNGERVNTVQAFLVPYAFIADSLADFQRRFAEAGIALPEGYRVEFGGEEEQRSDAMGKLAAFALPLFVVMAGSIVLTFNSFRLAGIIFAVAFLAVGLALLGVRIFGYPMGFVAIVGTMGLVGLAINDAIVVLNALRADPRARAADVEGSIRVVVGATRHIVATSLTTMGGFAPLILFGGRFWPPMATAIAGGVAGATVLALVFVPSVFMAIRRRETRRAATAPERAVPGSRRSVPRGPAAPEPAAAARSLAP